MDKLNIEEIERNAGSVTNKITGFDEDEFYRLKMLPHKKAEVELIQMLDERNMNLGTQWVCGYGILGLWFDNEAAYVRVGTSCD